VGAGLGWSGVGQPASPRRGWLRGLGGVGAELGSQAPLQKTWAQAGSLPWARVGADAGTGRRWGRT
jgi:hypothetical protein